MKLTQQQVDWVKARSRELEMLLETDMFKGRGTVHAEHVALQTIVKLHNIEVTSGMIGRAVSKAKDQKP